MSEIQKRPDPAEDYYGDEIKRHYRDVAKVAVEALRLMGDDLMSPESVIAVEALAKIEASGWKP